jgi:hypothetical protein
MRSPADALVRAGRVEGLLRGVALAALVAAIVAAVWQQRRSDGAPATVHVDVSGTPDPVERDSLAALARAGRDVSWSGELRAVMAVAEPLREPVAGWRVAVVGDSAMALRDSLDLLDTITTSATLTTEPTRGPVQAHEAGTVAFAAAPTHREADAVFVFGRVGWEPRFAITALEEIGWRVDARLELGRGRRVRQGVAAPSRERHGVVIVFDTASARREAALLQRFVRAGGGVVLAGEAAESRVFPARLDTVALALGDSTVLVRAARVGRGRVLSLDSAETWRWRMQGDGAPVEEHRMFWSRLVGLAAPIASEDDIVTPVPEANAHAAAAASPAAAASRSTARAAAPRAALVAALGPERPAPRRVPLAPATFPWWLAPIILLALITEWASRRRRGAP